MSLNRQAAVDYGKKFWNRVCDDGKIWTSSAAVLLADKRKKMGAPESDGWSAVYVSDGSGGEKGVFRRVKGGIVEEMPDAIAVWSGSHGLDDCTHYVCRCLTAEGVSLKETPRADELSVEMIGSSHSKTLALRTTKAQGQKVIDTGIFKAGDLVAYYMNSKGRYDHTAMFVGKQVGSSTDPGGITCHSVCRFQGLSAAWNGATDDDWFLHDEEGRSYTLVHFSDDDPAISATTRRWLPGWWKVGKEFYCVLENGRAYSTMHKPANATQKLIHSHSVGYYFQGISDVILILSKPNGVVQVERWAAPLGGKSTTAKIDGFISTVERVF
jgi:hypothetical protein